MHPCRDLAPDRRLDQAAGIERRIQQAFHLPRLDPRTLHCDSRFTDGDSGQRWPEMDDFGWFPFAQVPQLCTRKLSAVLCERLDLAALLVQLQQRTEQALAA